MRIFFLISLAVLLGSVAVAQTRATTEDGKAVILNDDGTWKYAAIAKSRPGSASPNPQEIISGKCLKDWPGDFEMRAYCEKKQNEALAGLAKGKPNDISEANYKQLLGKCTADWPGDFEMLEYCTNKQMEAVRKLKR